MKDQEFYDFCQSLYVNWLQGGSQLKDFKDDFETGHLSEPYFRLPLNDAQHGEKCLYVLNYNPGHGIDVQKRQRIKTDFAGKDFSAVADEMGKYYDSDEFARGSKENNAAKRNDKIKNFAVQGGFDSIMCVETFFLHSHSLNKPMFLKTSVSNELVKAYNEKLKAFLSDKAVLVIASIGGNRSIDKDAVKANPWLAYQLRILGTDLEQSTEIAIKQSKKCLTSAAIFVEGKKYLSYMMGSNNLPLLTDDNYRKIFGKKK